MLRKWHILASITIAVSVITVLSISAEESIIPSWIKNKAIYWMDGKITDAEFIDALNYLVENKIIGVNPVTEVENTQNTIPIWIKTNIKWWSEGSITDSEFAFAIQHFAKIGLIKTKNMNVNQQSLYDKHSKLADLLIKEKWKYRNQVKAIDSLKDHLNYLYENSKKESVVYGQPTSDTLERIVLTENQIIKLNEPLLVIQAQIDDIDNQIEELISSEAYKEALRMKDYEEIKKILEDVKIKANDEKLKTKARENIQQWNQKVQQLEKRFDVVRGTTNEQTRSNYESFFNSFSLSVKKYGEAINNLKNTSQNEVDEVIKDNESIINQKYISATSFLQNIENLARAKNQTTYKDQYEKAYGKNELRADLQCKGKIFSGILRDQNNNPIPNASIVLLYNHGNVVKSILTDSSGKWEIDVSKSPFYEVKITKSGFPAQYFDYTC